MFKKLSTSAPLNLDLGLLILRSFTFAFMLTHGWPKFQKLIAGNFQFADPIGLGVEASLFLAVFAEFFCSIFIILGFFTRPALIMNAITMTVAAFIAHGSDPFGDKEMALLYLAVSIGLIFTGPGKYAIDKK